MHQGWVAPISNCSVALGPDRGHAAFVVDAHGRICAATRQFMRLASRARPSSGLHLQELLHQAVAEGLISTFFGATSGAIPGPDLVDVRLGGARLRFSVTPLHDEHGDCTTLLFRADGRPNDASPDDMGSPERLGELEAVQAASTSSQAIDPATSPVAALAPPPAEEMSDRELRWEVAVLSANQGVWDHDFERDQHFLSDTWRALRGIGPDERVEETTEEWLATIHPDDVDAVQAEVRRQDRGETDIVNYQFRQQHRAGHWVWILSRGRIVRRDAAGLPARMIGTDTDITQIKNAEMERRQLADRLGIAIEVAEMGLWDLDLATSVKTCDPRLLRIYGIPDRGAQMPLSDWLDLVHPDDRAATADHFRACFKARTDIGCDYRVVTPDAEERHIRSRGKFVEDSGAAGRFHGVSMDITRDYVRTRELEIARSSLEHDSRHDALTGLANRRHLDEVMRRMGRDERRAVLHVDIDHFKQINDSFGHNAGDEALVHAAHILEKNLPKTALIARVGGDEFVALLVDPPDAMALDAMAADVVEELASPFVYAEHEISVSASIGIAMAQSSLDPVMINADLALYQAKKDGRRRHRFYDGQMRSQARQRKEAFDRLSSAAEGGEILCYYQPQFEAKSLKLSGLEALIRWDCPVRGLLAPDAFLGSAQEMGLIGKLDDIVLRQTLSDFHDWTAAGAVVPQISINVSAQRISDPGLAAYLRKLDVPYGKYSFELLESAFFDTSNDIVSQNLRLIREMGFGLEVDDFGSGHASILSLLGISPNRLKIDKDLVLPIVECRSQREIIKAIVGIGRLLNVGVVAEGVETNEHVAILQEIGVDYLQGYALARPMPAERVLELLVVAEARLA